MFHPGAICGGVAASINAQNARYARGGGSSGGDAGDVIGGLFVLGIIAALVYYFLG